MAKVIFATEVTLNHTNMLSLEILEINLEIKLQTGGLFCDKKKIRKINLKRKYAKGEKFSKRVEIFDNDHFLFKNKIFVVQLTVLTVKVE